MKPSGLVVTAVKPTEYRNSGVIVRLYNPTDVPVSGTHATGFPHRGAEAVNFRKEWIRGLNRAHRPRSPGGHSEFALEMAPYEIMTVWIPPGKKDVVTPWLMNRPG